MNEFKLRRARVGYWVRYANLPLMFWFLSDVPMPFDKRPLVWLTAAKVVINLLFHIHLELTGRFLVTSYVMLLIEMATTCFSLYVTGLAASPFLLVYPLHAFSAFYVDFSRKATIWSGSLGLVLLMLTYIIWWRSGPPAIIWDPGAFASFTWTVCIVQILILWAYVFLATETNPLVEELAAREQTLLQQAQRAELGTSMAMVAHELRNPLTTIGFSLEQFSRIARLPGADPQLPKAARYAEEELARISRMVQGILAYARERRGRMDITDHAPTALVDRAVEFLNLKWGRHRRTFTVDSDVTGAPPVRCDADATHQILVNLLDNAVQHPAPGRPLHLELRSETLDGRVAFVLRDNGAGIPADRVARLFDGFVTDRVEGTGLGLRISRQLAEDQQGAIEIASQEGIGTTVRLLLPVAGPDAPGGGPESAAASPPPSAPA